ncbi:hypothetical protein [Saccharopolyspora rosea]|uniref:PE domain-containing protein n=1 Tax=Saccharopolyspora rosea TaxID=524884 RepID=A0ABW3FS88_9PSEU|nr:hypothetical protein [Saccharopolyspora rosea]
MGDPARVRGHSAFYVDLDRASELLAELDEVRAKYETARERAAELGNIPSPFGDEVTVDVFRKIGERAQGGEGSLYETADGMARWIADFKDAVQKSIDEHKRIDDGNRMA